MFIFCCVCVCCIVSYRIDVVVSLGWVPFVIFLTASDYIAAPRITLNHVWPEPPMEKQM